MTNPEISAVFTAQDQQMLSALRKLVSEANRTEQAFNKLDSASKKMDSGFGSLSTKAAAVGSFIGNTLASAVTTAVSAFGNLIKSTIASSAELADLSENLGVSVSKLQLISLTAQASGTSLEKVTGAMFRLHRATQEAREGSDAQVKIFNALNISAEKLSKLPIDEQFIEVSEAISKMTDKTQQNAYATEIFGKSWSDVSKIAINMRQKLADTKAILDDLGITLTQLDSDNILALGSALDKMGSVLSGTASKIVAELAPAITLIVNGITGDLIPGWIQFGGSAARAIIAVIDEIAKLVKMLTDSLDQEAKSVFGNILDYIASPTRGMSLLVAGIWKAIEGYRTLRDDAKGAAEAANEAARAWHYATTGEVSRGGATGSWGDEGGSNTDRAFNAIHLNESGGRTSGVPNSHKGAVGPAQIMPGTWQLLKKRGLVEPNEDIKNAEDNLRVGKRFIEYLMKKYNNDIMRVAVAYHAGEGAADRSDWLEHSKTISDKDKNGKRGMITYDYAMKAKRAYDGSPQQTQSKNDVTGQQISNSEDAKQKAIDKTTRSMSLSAEQQAKLLNIIKTQGIPAYEEEKTKIDAHNAAIAANIEQGSQQYNQFTAAFIAKEKDAKKTQEVIDADKKAAQEKERLRIKQERLNEKIQESVEQADAYIKSTEEMLKAAEQGPAALEDAMLRARASAEAARSEAPKGSAEYNQIYDKVYQGGKNEIQMDRINATNESITSLEREREAQMQLSVALNEGYAAYERQLRVIQMTQQVRQDLGNVSNEEIQKELERRMAIDDTTAALERQNQLDSQRAQNNRPFTDMAQEAMAGSTDILTSAGQFDMLQQAIGGASDALINFAMTGQQSFAQFAISFIKQITAMIIKALIFKAIMSMIGMGGGAAISGGEGAALGGGSMGDTLASAKGNVFGFAKGGAFTNSIVTSPTMFKFANGGGFSAGVMGEAGPEAVMPLARDGQGRLGVRGGGGGGSQFNNQFNVVVNPAQGQSSQDAQKFGETINKAIEVKVTEIIAKQMRQQGGFSSGPDRRLYA